MAEFTQEPKRLPMNDTRYRSFFDDIPVSLYRTTPAGRFLDVNLAMVAMMGYPSREALLATNPVDHYVNPEDRERWKALLEQEEGVHNVEFQIRRCDGTIIWVSNTVRTKRDEQGCVLYYEGCLEDISKCKQAEAEREQSLTAERAQRRLAEAVCQASATVCSTLNYKEVLKRILEQMGQVVPHDTANILLIEGDQAQVIEGIGYDQFGIQVRATPVTLNIDKASILKKMREDGQPKAIPYVEREAEWVHARSEQTWIKSYAGAPIRIRSQVIGFLNVNSARPGFFDQNHAEQLLVFADQAAIAIENARLYDQQVRLTDAYSRFVPREFLSFLKKTSIVDVQLGDHIEQEMTVLFSDIRDFTTLSEHMTPQENFDFINSYLSHMEPVIHEYHGFIDKYIGDAIMASFPSTADDALQTAVAMFRMLGAYNHGRQKAGYQPVRIGVGLNTGRLMLGTVGGKDRMDGTVISDAVNLAARLEGLTKRYGVSIVISEQTRSHLRNTSAYHLRFLGKVRVKGKTVPVSIFEVYDADSEETKTLKMHTTADLEQGFQHYYARAFPKAAASFQQVLNTNPDDATANLYLKHATQFMAEGVPDAWDGTETSENK